MGVLQSIPLCARGNGENNPDKDPNTDGNNNSLPPAVQTSQPQGVPPPEATSTPRPQSPTGIANELYSNDSMASDAEAAVVTSSSGGDSGLEDSSATNEFEFRGLRFDLSRPVQDEGVHEEDTYDDTIPVDLDDDDDDIEDEDGSEEEEEDPVERPPEPTVPDERVGSDFDNEEEEEEETFTKDETTRKISTLLSELVGDRPTANLAQDSNSYVVPSR